MQEKDINYLIHKHSNNLKRTTPQLENLEIRYEQKENGLFDTKVKAKVKRKTIYLSNKSFNIESSLKRLFKKLNRVLQRRKYRIIRNASLRFKEVA